MAQSERSTTLEFQALAFLLKTGTDLVAPSTGTWSGAVAVGGADVRCVNEECSRRAEVGERYCATCDLERELFWRDARRRGSATWKNRGAGAAVAAAPPKRQAIR